MKRGNVSRRLLISRFFTRSGDQAWDFAVPVVLLKIYPSQIHIAAFYYLLVKVGQVLLLPSLASLIDRISRLKAIQVGIGLQFFSILVASVAVIYGLTGTEGILSPWLLILIISGIGSSLGSSFMEISVANDLVPAAISKESLGAFNSRLRQVDLGTEVGAPVVSGSLLLITQVNIPHLGFLIIVIWNLISFIPEYFLIRSALMLQPELLRKKLAVALTSRDSIFGKLKDGWAVFFKQPIALATVAYALLWISALSPHGVLLTGFLNDGWKVPEIYIGIFRGLGALFGLAATLLYPLVIKKLGLLRGSQAFLIFQSLSLLISLIGFFYGTTEGQLLFLGGVLLSRIGLYGFSLGEIQIRQIAIPSAVRGEVNGFASATTSIATLILYGAGSLLPSTGDFSILVLGSVGAVFLATMLFLFWSNRFDQSSLFNFKD